MREKGIVSAAENGFCRVKFVRSGACGENCAQCSGACSVKNGECVAVNSAGAEPGDVVVMEMDSKKVLKSAFLVYIVPLAVFILCYLAADMFFVSQGVCAAVSICAAAIVFLLLRQFDKTHSEEYRVYVTEIVKKA